MTSYSTSGALYQDMSGPRPPKATLTAYILLIFFGIIGVHKFYLNRPGMGVLYIFTLGLFLVGVIYDLFTLPKQVAKRNAEMKAEAAADSASTAE
jgi:hypothetical protein